MPFNVNILADLQRKLYVYFLYGWRKSNIINLKYATDSFDHRAFTRVAVKFHIDANDFIVFANNALNDAYSAIYESFGGF